MESKATWRVRWWGAVSLAACLLFALAPLAMGRENQARKPNVLVILADDLGYGDIGVHGCRDIPTPNIDSLAKAGVRCTDGYASCPVCAPTRAGLLTGRYQQRFGFEFNPGPFGLPTSEKTIADLLKSAGYATGAIGKWHLGLEPQWHPLERGFTEFYGFLHGARPYLPITPDSKKEPWIPHDPLVRNRERAPEVEYITDALGQEAVAFIDRHKAEPFFLYVAFNAVHAPLQATEKYLARFPDIQDETRRTYAAMLSAMDDAIGQMLKKLAAEDLDRETLVFFLSDNGGPEGRGKTGSNAADNGPLRGEKGTSYEGGIRVPFLVRWPGKIPAGVAYSKQVISLDIFATALAAAGVQPSASPKLDGVNLLPYLGGDKKSQSPHNALYWRYGDQRAVRKGDWKLTMSGESPAALFNLTDDIGEAHDLSSQQPARAQELQKLFDSWSAELPPPIANSLQSKK